MAILSVFALLGTLFVLASANPTAADPKPCDTELESSGECKEPPPDNCREVLKVDKETIRALRNSGGWNGEACCIDWDYDGEIASWMENYRCEAPVCAEAFGDDYHRITETWGNLVTDECCVEYSLDAQTPPWLLNYRCPDPEPTPTAEATPTEPPVIVVPPPDVRVTVLPPTTVAPPVTRVLTPTFTG